MSFSIENIALNQSTNQSAYNSGSQNYISAYANFLSTPVINFYSGYYIIYNGDTEGNVPSSSPSSVSVYNYASIPFNEISSSNNFILNTPIIADSPSPERWGYFFPLVAGKYLVNLSLTGCVSDTGVSNATFYLYMMNGTDFGAGPVYSFPFLASSNNPNQYTFSAVIPANAYNGELNQNYIHFSINCTPSAVITFNLLNANVTITYQSSL